MVVTTRSAKKKAAAMARTPRDEDETSQASDEKEAKIKKQMSVQKMKTMFMTFVLTAVGSIAAVKLMPGNDHVLMVARITLAIFFLMGGAAHFDTSRNKFYVAMMPPFLPFPDFLHKLAGAIEVVSALALFCPSAKIVNMGAWSLQLTLWAVFPANVYCALSESTRAKIGMDSQAAWIRLPIQLIFAAWVHLQVTGSLADTWADAQAMVGM